MQTRARNVGGDLEITTEPDDGTTILVWMPYIQDSEPQEKTKP
jgi:signal transduction histidine kinase